MIKDVLNTILKQNTDIPVFYQRADVNAEYPFFVYEYRRLNEIDGFQSCVLEINAWDLYKTSSRIESKMDALERKINRLVINDESVVIITHSDSRQPIDDENKDIKRIRALFQMQVYERR